MPGPIFQLETLIPIAMPIAVATTMLPTTITATAPGDIPWRRLPLVGGRIRQPTGALFGGVEGVMVGGAREAALVGGAGDVVTGPAHARVSALKRHPGRTT